MLTLLIQGPVRELERDRREYIMKGFETLARGSNFILGLTENGWKVLSREVTSSDYS